jgi:osmotically-inducible protein OsmY
MAEAEQALLKLPGVSGVANRLRVRPFESEEELKSRVIDALVARAHSVANRITVGRRNGVVTLRGTLSSPLYKEVAGEVAKGAVGESKVEDSLTVEFSAS